MGFLKSSQTEFQIADEPTDAIYISEGSESKISDDDDGEVNDRDDHAGMVEADDDREAIVDAYSRCGETHDQATKAQTEESVGAKLTSNNHSVVNTKYQPMHCEAVLTELVSTLRESYADDHDHLDDAGTLIVDSEKGVAVHSLSSAPGLNRLEPG